MPKVSEEHRTRRRSQILAAARRRFALEGFHATSMKDVLAESGLSAGAVYGYFPSKDDLVVAIAIESMSGIAQAVATLAERDPEATLADVIVAAVAAVRAKDEEEAVAGLAVQVWSEAARNPVLAARLAESYGRFRTTMRDVLRQRDPTMPEASADAVAGVAASLIPGFLLQRAVLTPASSDGFELGLRLLLAIGQVTPSTHGG